VQAAYSCTDCAICIPIWKQLENLEFKQELLRIARVFNRHQSMFFGASLLQMVSAILTIPAKDVDEYDIAYLGSKHCLASTTCCPFFTVTYFLLLETMLNY
jgi:hypothetical protein